MKCQLCGRAIEKVFGRWYHVDHHTIDNPYDHRAEPDLRAMAEAQWQAVEKAQHGRSWPRK